MRSLLLPLWFLFLSLQAVAFGANKPSTQASLPELTRVKILEIDPSDPNYAERFKLLGKFGIASKGGLLNDGTNFFGGSVTMDDSRLLYFDKISVEALNVSPSVIKGTRYTGPTIAMGKRVKILEISPSDTTNYPNRGRLLGITCTVYSYDLYNYGGGLFGGSVYCDDGGSYYFSYWALEVVTTKVVTKPATASELPVLTRVRIKGLGASDPYYYDRTFLSGKDGVVDTAPLKRGSGYYAGTVRILGTPYYFTQVEVELYESTSNGSLSMGANIIPTGTMVQIEALGPFDKFYNTRSTLEGQIGVVGPADSLRRIDETGFYSGSIAINGKSEYYYQVAVSAFQGGLPSQKSNSLTAGTKVKILDISSSDANFKDRAAIVGKSGEVAGGSLAQGSGPWLTGFISTTDGGYYYFSGVYVVVTGSADTTSTKAKEVPATAARLSPGTKVRIIEIGPADGAYTYKSSLIGKIASISSEVVTYEKSTTSGLTYYSGGPVIVDGATYYPYQWSFSIITE